MINIDKQPDKMPAGPMAAAGLGAIGPAVVGCLTILVLPVILVLSLIPVMTSNTATSAKASTTAATTLFARQALAQTNTYRTTHGAPELTTNKDLTTIAETYAKQLCSTNTFAHSGNTYQGQSLGENLWTKSSSSAMTADSIDGAEPVNAWYSEISAYNFAAPGFSSATGHFTQLVWKSTTETGIGVCCTASGTTCYAVANYLPAGNLAGAFPANVLQASGK